MKNDIGKRMKEFYEIRTRTSLPRRTNTIIRIDGKAFHTYTKGLDRPFDKGLIEDMAETTKYLCSEIQGAKIGYCQSDEISILLTDYDKIGTHAWFDGQVQKIVSVAASLATAKFNQLRYIREIKMYQEKGIPVDTNSVIAMLQNKPIATEDARVFSIPQEHEVVNYFIWRQEDATRNSISMAAQANFSHNQLHKKTTSNMQDMLMEKGINWNDYSTSEKRGSMIKKIQHTWIVNDNDPKTATRVVPNMSFKLLKNQSTFTRGVWEAVDTPIFTKDKDAILGELPTQ